MDKETKAIYPTGAGTSTKHNSHCLAKASDDEPIFVLRAKDPTAPSVVRNWAVKNKSNQPHAKIQSAFALAKEMEVWHQEHKHTF